VFVIIQLRDILQVQVKQWNCTRSRGVSCVCGVAMREGATILIADMCLNDSSVMSHPVYVTYNAKDLPPDAGIMVSDSGLTFKVITISYVCRNTHG